MSKKTTDTQKKLALKKESLRTLSSNDLEQANGGYVIRKLTYCCLGQGGGGGGCAPAP